MSILNDLRIRACKILKGNSPSSDLPVKSKNFNALIDYLESSPSLDYKVYTAILLQSGTGAPTATVIKNTLGGDLVWAYAGVGEYTATLSQAFPSVNKVHFQVHNGVFDTQTAFYWAWANGLQLDTSTLAGAATNNHLTDVSVEVRVYN